MPRRSSIDTDPQHERKRTDSERFSSLSFGKKNLGSSRDPSVNRRRGSNTAFDPSNSNTDAKGMDEKMLMPRFATARRIRSQERLSNGRTRIDEEEAPPSRTASFFRLSRTSFNRKKSVEKFASDESASPIATASFESQRSSASAESSNSPGTKEVLSSSPEIHRGILQPSWPRSSIASSREGEWISDMDVNRASSDLDSLIGQRARPWLRRNGSSTSSSDSISEAEDFEMMNSSQSADTYASLTPAGSSRLPTTIPNSSTEDRNQLAPPARIRPSRSVSAFSVMKRQGSEDGVLSKQRINHPLHYTPSTQSLRDGFSIPVSPGKAPDSPLPPLPALQSPKTTLFPPDESVESFSSTGPSNSVYSTQRDSLMVPSSASSSKTLRKTKSQNSLLRLIRKPSFLNSIEANGYAKEHPKSATFHRQSPHDSPSDNNEGILREVRRSIFRNGKPKMNGEAIFGLNTSSKTSLVSSGFNTPITSSPIQERLQPFFTRSSSKDSLPALFDRKPYGDVIQPLTERHRSASAATSRHASPSGRSKLQSNGGASGLFTGPTQRQRAASLLPAMSWRSKNQGISNLKLSTTSRELEDGLIIEKKRPSIPKIDTDQFSGDAEEFVRHVLATIPRDDIAAVLAASSDEIHKQALATYMLRFSFAGNAFDIAIRKLLMTLCLPKETQQIDRVMEAFAQRYNDCNEELFDNVDQPYVLAFSLMMLHTDAFNKNAKQKMSKSEYLRNTSSCGVPAEILEYLYDNLTFTQFIYVDDDELLSRRKSEGESSTSGSFLSALSSTSNASSTKNKIDPYYIIANGQTHTLCANIGNFISLENPFSATGTSSDIDIDSLNRKFVNAPSIEIVTTKKPVLASSAAATTLGSEGLATNIFGSVQPEEEIVVSLRVTKIGCVSRKDDIVEENKKASSRRWKTCGMLLTSSQLLFFKDLIWTSALTQQIKEQTRNASNHEGGIVITPRLTHFKPDGVLALSDVIAVQDKSYSKYQNVLRLFAKQGESYRQYLIQAVSEADMNDWIHRINFCAAFRACGLRIRGLDLPATPSLDGDSSRSTSLSLSRQGQERSSSSDLENNFKSLTNSEASNGMSEVLQWKLDARRQELMPKLELVNAKYVQCQVELDKQLKFAKHLSILTPFMKVTRDRIESSAQSLAQQVRRSQLEHAKYYNRRRVLMLELEAGDRAVRDTAFTLSFVDVGTSEEVADEPILQSTMSLDQLSLPTPSSSFSIHESATSRSSSGSYQRSEIKQMRGDVEQDAATPKVKTSEILQAVEVSEEADAKAQRTSAFKIDHGKNSRSSSSSPKPAPALRGLGFEDNNALMPDHLNGTTYSNTVGKQSNRWLKTISAHSSPREEAERWDKSKVVRNAKRVSLATLPDAEHLMDLSRMSLLYASGAIISDEDTPSSSA